jgi:hypothetical protein
MKITKMLLLVAALFSIDTLKAQQDTKKAIQDLVANVCQNGSVKLSPQQKTTMADWLKVNSEAITNVHPSEFKGEGPNAADSNTPYSNRDFKFAESKDALYVFCMDAPTADMRIKALCTTVGGRIVGTVKLLGSDERMSWEMEERELNLEKPHVLPKDGVTVFKITWTEYYKERPVDHSIKILNP